MLGYHYTAGLNWLDSLLNAAMILGGMGPVDRLEAPGAKIFASLYALFSGLVIIGPVSRAGGAVRSPTVAPFPCCRRAMIVSDTPQPTAKRRRWFRFSLRMLLIVMTVLCVWRGDRGQCGAAARRRLWPRFLKRAGALCTILSAAGKCSRRAGCIKKFAGPGWLRRLLGDEYFEDVIGVGFSGVKNPRSMCCNSSADCRNWK